MEITCANLQEIVSSFSLVKKCDVIKNGALRIATPFHYPDGSLIDVFLKEVTGNPGYYLLSDYGQTADYVADLQFQLFGSKRRKELIDDICHVLKVKAQDGCFEIILSPREMETLPQAIVRLAQASIRATDLIYIQKAQSAGGFQDEVEDFLAQKTLNYETDAVLRGVGGKPIKVDFRVKGGMTNSLVQTLAGRTGMHQRANERLSRWMALEAYGPSNQFITLVDHSAVGVQESDLLLLGKLSQIFTFPEDREEFYEAVAA